MQALRVDAGHEDVEGGARHPGPETLHDPCGDEDPHRRREPGNDEPGGEEGQAEEQGRTGTSTVGEVAGPDDADEAGRERRGEGHGVEGGAVELTGDRRHDRRQGQGLERVQGDEGEHADGRGPQGRREDAAAVVLGRQQPVPVLGGGVLEAACSEAACSDSVLTRSLRCRRSLATLGLQARSRSSRPASAGPQRGVG